MPKRTRPPTLLCYSYENVAERKGELYEKFYGDGNKVVGFDVPVEIFIAVEGQKFLFRAESDGSSTEVEIVAVPHTSPWGVSEGITKSLFKDKIYPKPAAKTPCK